MLDPTTLAMMRDTNRLINGDMRIDARQAGGSITVTSSSVFCVDRWRSGMTGANGTGQRVACSLTGFPYMLQLTGGVGTTSAWVGQMVESVNCTSLVGQRVTIQFRAASSNVTSLTVNLKSATATDNFTSTNLVESQSVTITSTLTYYELTFAASMPASAANGLYLEFVTGSNLGTGTLQMTGVQLESGTKTSPFVFRHYRDEVALCQRYFEKSGVGALGATWTANAAESVGMSHPTGNFRMSIPFRVTKRAAPTFTTYDRTGASGKCSYFVAAWTDAGALPVSSSLASGAYVGHNIASSVETQLSWSAEAEIS